MIDYLDGPFGARIIFRAHGSAVVKALIPAMSSTLILYGIQLSKDYDDITSKDKEKFIAHPYAIGALLAAFSFLIVFRANFAYSRYWEAAADVHQMHSKWMDMSTALASFHYQSSIYNRVRPPAFGQHEELQDLLLNRELNPCTPDELKEQLDELEAEERDESIVTKAFNYTIKRPIMMLTPTENKSKQNTRPSLAVSQGAFSYRSRSPSQLEQIVSLPKLDGGMHNHEPSLFLQEFAHLMSLMSAVAMNTLRGSFEGTDLPLIEYVPGSKWPPVDPDDLQAEIRKGYYESNRLLTDLLWLFGLTRNKKQRSLYNAARPFRVLGGVSDAEMHLLKKAQGPSAKVSLCSVWLQEFVTRETMAGSTDGVAAPILSRLYQYCSDGMIGYNQARKIAFTPFPFPHTQVTTLFVAVVVLFMPVLMYSFANSWWLAYSLDFFTVLCFTSLHMVALELENPFQNVPNDLPLTTYQAEFNEALISMFAGFNPDSWWEVSKQHFSSIQEKQMSAKEKDGMGLTADFQTKYGSIDRVNSLDIESQAQAETS